MKVMFIASGYITFILCCEIHFMGVSWRMLGYLIRIVAEFNMLPEKRAIFILAVTDKNNR